jgi:SAM-dependent methyltransferase
VEAEDSSDDCPKVQRFSGFAGLYDTNRPAPPSALGPLLARYANVSHPNVVDLGSGTGLSSRWAATWAASVIGVEPNPEMRAVAQSTFSPRVEYRSGSAEATGLPESSVDIVLVVQAMHWMDPTPTLAEVARILRPGGVLAAIDADWPPVSGVVQAERAWARLHGRIRVFESRLARGESGKELRRPIDPDDPVLADRDLSDTHRNRLLPGGLRSWSKSEHLRRMSSSGHFTFTRELTLSGPVEGGVERFVNLMYSQGSYQGLLKAGLGPGEIGANEFEENVYAGFARAVGFDGLSFSWRVRIGISPIPGESSAEGIGSAGRLT